MTKRKSGRKSYDDFDDFDDFEAYSDFGEFGDEDTFIPDDDAEDPDTGWGYYTDYETPPEAIILNGPFHAVARRGKFGASWWGRQWVTAMEAHDRDGRLDRGRSYARHGNVKRLEISHGQTFAKVQGSRPAPYLTRVYLRPFTDEEWRAALTALAAQAIYAAKLLTGEMPSDIETVFNGVNLSLFPRDRRDISFECTCPDYGDPCKHAAAVYYLLAEQLDADPFILLHLRGRTREQALAALRARAQADRPAPAIDLANFWSANDLPHSAPPGPLRPAFAKYGDPPDRLGDALHGLYHAVSSTVREHLA